MTTGTLVGHPFKRDRLVDDRAIAVTDVAAQAEEIEAGFVVDQDRDPHLRQIDVGQPVIERLRRASLDARNVFAHFTGHLARREVRRAGRHRRFRLGQLQRVVRAIPNAQTAADAGAEKIGFG